MANSAIIPFLGVNKWQKMTHTQATQYVSKWLDDYWFSQTKRSYEDGACYIHKWLPDDSIRDQFIANYGPWELVVYDKNGKEVYRQNVETKQQDLYKPGYYIRQFELDLSSVLDPGYYYPALEVGDNDPWISEPFEIVTSFPQSLYVEYYHPVYKDGVWFDAPFRPAFRIPAIIDYEKPGNRATIYEDQPANMTMVKSVPYRIHKLTVGDAKGIPPWVIDKLDRIMGCEFVKFDGRYMTKQEGTDWEKNKADPRYKKDGWAHEMREKINRNGTTYEDDVLITGTVVAAAVIDAKGFGVSDNGGDFLEIQDIN